MPCAAPMSEAGVGCPGFTFHICQMGTMEQIFQSRIWLKMLNYLITNACKYMYFFVNTDDNEDTPPTQTRFVKLDGEWVAVALFWPGWGVFIFTSWVLQNSLPTLPQAPTYSAPFGLWECVQRPGQLWSQVRPLTLLSPSGFWTFGTLWR